MPGATCRKRPCKICHRWFLPDPRLGDRQKTCALPDCRKKWHRKQCAKWNKANKEYFKGIYLQKKLAGCCKSEACNSRQEARQPPASRIHLNLPRSDIAEVITAKGVIIADYIIEQLIGRMRPWRMPVAGTDAGICRPAAMNNSP